MILHLHASKLDEGTHHSMLMFVMKIKRRLPGSLGVDNIRYKLVDVISDRSDVITGDFKSVVSSVPSIKRELRKLSKPSAQLSTHVYNVYIMIGHDDLLGEL